jgi:hypothetical protein
MGKGLELHIHIFAERVVFTWSFLAIKGVMSVEA